MWFNAFRDFAAVSVYHPLSSAISNTDNYQGQLIKEMYANLIDKGKGELFL